MEELEIMALLAYMALFNSSGGQNMLSSNLLKNNEWLSYNMNTSAVYLNGK